MIPLTGECPKFLRILESEKRSKSDNFRKNLVEFRVEIHLCLKHTVTFGHSPVKRCLVGKYNLAKLKTLFQRYITFDNYKLTRLFTQLVT